MRSARVVGSLLLTLIPAFAMGQTKLPIQQAIEAKYALSKPTADRKDIVTAGAVIDLLKDNLVMVAVSAPTTSNVTFEEGRFKTSGFTKFSTFHVGMGAASTPSRTFVAGEKFFLIGAMVRDDGAVLEFLSDPISDVRYKVFVRYPFVKGVIPAPDVVMAAIAQTIKAEPMDNQQQAGGDQAPAPAAKSVAPAAPAPAMADIPPPPPPTDAPPAAPKSISLGQTKDQVAANFGPPTKVVNLPTKEIDYYPDMKVTFVKGKVTDVQ